MAWPTNASCWFPSRTSARLAGLEPRVPLKPQIGDAAPSAYVAAERHVGAVAAAAIAIAGRVEQAANARDQGAALHIGDGRHANVAPVPRIGAWRAGEIAAIVALGSAYRRPRAGADRLTLADIVAVADQPIDDVLDDALGVRVGFEILCRGGNRKAAGQTEG